MCENSLKNLPSAGVLALRHKNWQRKSAPNECQADGSFPVVSLKLVPLEQQEQDSCCSCEQKHVLGQATQWKPTSIPVALMTTTTLIIMNFVNSKKR